MRKVPSAGILFLAVVLLFPAIAFAAGEDPSIPLLLYLVVILVTAKLLGHLAVVLVFEGERVIGPTTYSAVVIMVIVTTLVAPPLLKWSLADRRVPDAL